jgi:hypothetical protein
MAYIGTPNALDGERWFHAVDPELEIEGIWHEGPVAPGKKTWPAGPARCGYVQPDIAIGRHVTALSIGTQKENICPLCLASLRSDYDHMFDRI